MYFYFLSAFVVVDGKLYPLHKQVLTYHIKIYCRNISKFKFTFATSEILPIPVAGPSKAWVYGSWFAEVAGSNSAGGMNECLLRPLCVVM